MSENLPLIPEKGAICGDVRGVLRGVFRELGAPVPTPQKAVPIGQGSYASSDLLPTLQDTHWKYKISTEYEKLSQCEDLLRQEYAKRLSRSPLPNIYRVCRARATSEPSERSERSECGKWLRRRHLTPSVQQHANREDSLWVRNMLCPSSETMHGPEGQTAPWCSPVSPFMWNIPVDETSPRSLSIGTARPPLTPPPLPAPPDAPLLDYILCVPPCLEFVNFDVGQEHVQTLRLVNLSKAELRLSVRPPSRRELRVSVGKRGQRVTAGAATVLNVSFTPRDVRTVYEQLHVKVSSGMSLVVPIRCYIQPPILDVLVPLQPSLSMSCYPELCDVSASVIDGNATGRGDSGNGEVLELGAHLLGDIHCVQILLQCHAEHAAFFLITEESWINYTLEGVTSGGAVVCGNFAWFPAFWRGGGCARGTVWCRARTPGLHAVGLRILSSTAAVRPLCLLADSLLFYREHITLKAQEKDYDICSETDPSCEYYVHLGTAFPGHTLTATVQLINHSPISYVYYWTVRPWGLCSCRGEDCEGATQRRSQDVQTDLSPDELMALGGVRVEPTRGRISPRSASTLHVCVQDVGDQLGVQRASLMLILKDIPKESFPPGYDSMIVSCQTIESEPMPGCESEPREVCEVVCCEMEVWWEVAPVRFVLDPPLLRLPHSRRVDQVKITLRATQLFGREPITAEWRLPPTYPLLAEVAHLTPTQSLTTRFTVGLPSMPDDAKPHHKMDNFELVCANEEWRSYSTVKREPERRAMGITPPARWLGIVAPGAHVSTDLVVHNDTYQQVDWTCSAVRWCGDISGSAWCEGREPCTTCHVRGCSCALLWPTEGTLPHTGSETIRFAVYAPKRDGCVLILVGAKRVAPGDRGRSSLIAFRVLAPRLILRALDCCGDHRSGRMCECCAIDVVKASGAAVLRPRKSLSAGRSTCCRLLVTNLSPVATNVTLVCANEEWRSYSTVKREPERRAMGITPPARWLGIVAPGAHVSTDLVVHNDTYQQVDWTCSAVRWCGDISGSAWCEGREPCTTCHVRGCSCALLWPTEGTLPHTGSETIRFAVYAPKRDGCVLILVGAKRVAPGDRGRSSLIAFRVLAPRLILRALDCCGDHRSGRMCECCAIDVVKASGAAVLRPRKSLSAGRSTCCRLLVTNLSPVATNVTWEPPLNSDEALRVTFFPNEIAIGPYESIEIQVLIEAMRVSLRRVFFWRAHVEHTSVPLYFLIDTDVAGVEVTVELPLGGGPDPDSTVFVRRTQKEKPALSTETANASCNHIFEEFERQQVEYIRKMFACRCPSPPHRSARNTPASLDIGRIPVRLPRVPLCLQYSQLPLHTVRRRTLVLRNVAVLPARWSARVRRWPRHRTNTLAADKWASNMRDPGVAIEVHPSKGELTTGRRVKAAEGGDIVRVSVDVYADCAGLYHDQLLVQIENVEPIILDVWVEAIGLPLMFYSAPSRGLPPPLWLSSADDQRMIRARNTTRSRLFIRAYLLLDHDDEHDREKLRLYMRLEDGEPPPPSPLPSDCMSISGEISDASSYQPDPTTKVELFLSEDYGLQYLTPYKVEPESCELEPGADILWQVSRIQELEDQLPPEAVLMLRCEPLDKAGDNWYRPTPPPQTVQIRLARRNGRLQVSTKEVRVKICALNLPFNEVLRVRKRFHVMNVGDGPLSVCAYVRSPWLMVTEPEETPKVCGVGCLTKPVRSWAEELPLKLFHGSSTEICVEVSIPRVAATPPIVQDPPDTKKYRDNHVIVTPFVIRDELEVHAKLNLVLEIEYPAVSVEPEVINFRFVTDADTRKTYFTVRHSSRSETLYLMVQWQGPPDFLLEPDHVCVPPGVTRRVYVQYTAAWCAAPVEGKVIVTSRRAPWCCASVTCRAAPIRDNQCQPTYDYTDDPVLLPPEYRKYASDLGSSDTKCFSN